MERGYRSRSAWKEISSPAMALAATVGTGNIVGVATAGDSFASVANAMTILRLASVIGVVSVGMTFVIGGGGIDLSVGAEVALASVWATTLATQTIAADTHWIVMVFTALAVGAGCGLVNGVLIAYGRIAPFIATLAMLAGARGLAIAAAVLVAELIGQPVRRRIQHRAFPVAGRSPGEPPRPPA